MSRLKKLKLFLKIASGNILDEFIENDDLPIFKKLTKKYYARV